MSDPFLELMTKAATHARQHGGRYVPTLSPDKSTVLGPSASVDVRALQAAGFRVVPWTLNRMEEIRGALRLHVAGIISDRPDSLEHARQEACAQAGDNAAELAYLDRVDMQGHRGARGLRPENTLPAFEAGLDNGINTIETDVGVTADPQAILWHDQFLNPESCRRADGQLYDLEHRVYVQDISMANTEREFLCDKVHFGPDQENDLELSPVSVAFAATEHMISPYAPIRVAQLFRFVNFYEQWYRSGPGKTTTHATARAHTAAQVHFNLEAKILPPGYSEAGMMAHETGETIDQLKASGKLPEWAFAPSRTMPMEIFVETLCRCVRTYHMEDRSNIQSFDFHTLLRVQERYPEIRTCYLTGSPALLSTGAVPAILRVGTR